MDKENAKRVLREVTITGIAQKDANDKVTLEEVNEAIKVLLEEKDYPRELLLADNC